VSLNVKFTKKAEERLNSVIGRVIHTKGTASFSDNFQFTDVLLMGQARRDALYSDVGVAALIFRTIAAEERLQFPYDN
jgi:hypothetical protein